KKLDSISHLYIANDVDFLSGDLESGENIDANKSIARDIYTKYDPIAKEMYKYEPVAEHYEEKGYAMAPYLSLILADGIAKVFADDRRASTISS
ncbi:hypothetical protein Gorai_009594, partial [Gossypium raimondii]|nr:hypothetical protein [Gossypium raimondii]